MGGKAFTHDVIANSPSGTSHPERIQRYNDGEHETDDMSNDALNVNAHPPPHGVNGQTSAIGITYRGSNWYFTVCAIMTVSTFVFIGLSFTKPRTHRIFHYITAAITLVAAIAYFSMGADLGQTPIPVQFERSDPKVSGTPDNQNREIFYVRYIDWVITTPLLLLDLLLTAGMPWPTILYTILIDEVMIVTGLVGALVQSSYKVWTISSTVLASHPF
ncbi:MAG: hypothetical protein Q9192_003930 [Flavoplaca navasiana]